MILFCQEVESEQEDSPESADSENIVEGSPSLTIYNEDTGTTLTVEEVTEDVVLIDMPSLLTSETGAGPSNAPMVDAVDAVRELENTVASVKRMLDLEEEEVASEYLISERLQYTLQSR